MTLTDDERILFFSNWLGLLAFVNDKYDIVDDFGFIDGIGIDIGDAIKIRNKLWRNSFIIDKYIKSEKLKGEDLHLVFSWKRSRKGKYLILKEADGYTVLVDIKKEMLYGVHGLSDTLSEKVPYLPFLAETVLMPFKGKIVYDGLLESPNCEFGENDKAAFEEIYDEILKEKGIKITL